MDTELQTFIINFSPSAPVGTLTAQLREAGYTVAEIQQALNAVASTSTTTPQIIAYLQQENAKLQSSQRMNQLMWFGGLLLGGWLLLRNRRSN